MKLDIREYILSCFHLLLTSFSFEFLSRLSFCLSVRYCPECKTDTNEVILAGEKMRITKKKANMVSRKSGSGRDWGKVQLEHNA